MLSQQKNFNYFFFSVADESGALDYTTRHFTKVSSLPLLGLEYCHKHLDRYSTKGQMRKTLLDILSKVKSGNKKLDRS